MAKRKVPFGKRRRGKYNAIKTKIGGITFASRKEATRYLILLDMQTKGEITDLVIQPPYPIIVNEVKVCVYFGDFGYRKNGELVVEDVKCQSTKTPVYRLKKKLVKVLYGIDITEVE